MATGCPFFSKVLLNYSDAQVRTKCYIFHHGQIVCGRGGGGVTALLFE